MDHHQFILCLVILLGYTSSGLNAQDPYGMRPLTTGKLITPSGDTNVLWPAPGTEYGGGMLGGMTGYGGNFPTGTFSATNGMYQGAYSGGQYPGGGGGGMGAYTQVSPYGANPYQSVGNRPYPYQSGSYQPGAYQSGMGGQQQPGYYQSGYNSVPGTY